MRSTCSFFFFQAEDGIRDRDVTGVQTCALPISAALPLVQDGDGTNPAAGAADDLDGEARSEERRVGKECRSRWASYHLKKKGSVRPSMLCCVLRMVSDPCSDVDSLASC